MNLEIKSLKVKYNGKFVGVLQETPRGIAFQYSNSWIEEGFSISPLSLPLSNKVFLQTKSTNDGLFAVFHDSLPGGWGALVLVKKLAKEGINYERLSPLTKLSLTNNLSLGALTYEPQELNDEEAILFHDIDEIAENVDFIYENNSETILFDEIASLASASQGSRPKIYANLDNQQWIIKFKAAIDSKDIGKEEYESNLLARKCGINVNECRLFESKKSSGYFGCKRFDRIEGKRVHMIYLSSVLETSYQIPNLDYVHLIKVCQNMCVEEEDIYEAYRRMCFNVFYGNKDDHGNNFAFIYDESIQGYKISPFYDITNTSFLREHTMTANGNPNPTEDDLLEVAKLTKLSLTKCKNIISSIKSVLGK